MRGSRRTAKSDRSKAALLAARREETTTSEIRWHCRSNEAPSGWETTGGAFRFEVIPTAEGGGHEAEKGRPAEV